MLLMHKSEFNSLRKQRTFREVATRALAKGRLSNERGNSILMTRHYPDLGSVWVVTRHQYGIFALVTQTSFREGTSGDLA